MSKFTLKKQAFDLICPRHRAGLMQDLREFTENSKPFGSVANFFEYPQLERRC